MFMTMYVFTTSAPKDEDVLDGSPLLGPPIYKTLTILQQMSTVVVAVVVELCSVLPGMECLI